MSPLLKYIHLPFNWPWSFKDGSSSAAAPEKVAMQPKIRPFIRRSLDRLRGVRTLSKKQLLEDEDVCSRFNSTDDNNESSVAGSAAAPEAMGGEVIEVVVEVPVSKGGEVEAEVVVAPEPEGRRVEVVVVAPEPKGRGVEEVVVAPEPQERRVEEVVVAPEPKGRGVEEVAMAPEPKGRGVEEVAMAPEPQERGVEELIVAPEPQERGVEEVITAPEPQERGVKEVAMAPKPQERGVEEVIEIEKATTMEETTNTKEEYVECRRTNRENALHSRSPSFSVYCKDTSDKDSSETEEEEDDKMTEDSEGSNIIKPLNPREGSTSLTKKRRKKGRLFKKNLFKVNSCYYPACGSCRRVHTRSM